MHEHCLHVLKSKYHVLGGQQRIEADVLYYVNFFVFDIIREMSAVTEFLTNDSPQKTRLGRLARWLSDLEELISDRFTEILSRDSHPELVAVQRAIGTLSRKAAALPSRTRADDLVDLGRKTRMNQLHIFEKQKAKTYCEDVIERNKGKVASDHKQRSDVADALFQAVQELSLASPGASTSTSGGKREERAEPPEDRQSFSGSASRQASPSRPMTRHFKKQHQPQGGK
jgi:hypothetical protein